MKFYLVNYSNEKYDHLRQLQNLMGKGIFDGIFSYTEEDLKTHHSSFYNTHSDLFKEERGAGYWIWKPFIIQHTLSSIEDNDVIFYIDSGDIFYPSIKNILQRYFTSNDILLTTGSFPHKNWTKGDCFHFMGCTEEKYYNAKQLEAGVCAFKKTPFNLDFVNEWLSYCSQYQILNDAPNIHQENFKGFVDHRHDQSILTNLAVKYGISSTDIIRSVVKCNVFP